MFGKRRRIRGSSVLRDIIAAGPQKDQPNIYEPETTLTPPSTVGSAQVLPGALYGPHYAEVRNVIEIPFDDSLDSSFPLECFFIMPTGTTKVNSAKIYIQQKPFRMYSSLAGAGGGSTTSSAGGATTSSTGGNPTDTEVGHVHAGSTTDTQGAHAHASHAHDFNHAATEDNSYASHDHATGVNSFIDNPHSHTGHSTHLHDTLGGHSHSYNTTGTGSGHWHTVASHSHTIGSHTHDVSNAHTHTLTAGIFESGPTGTFSLQVSDDGTTYGAALTSGVTSADGLSLDGLTQSAGAKRIKITATGLQRVQVLVVLDLLVQVVLPS